MELWYAEWPQDQRHKIEFIMYKDAGHLIEPPYSPLNRATYIRGTTLGSKYFFVRDNLFF